MASLYPQYSIAIVQKLYLPVVWSSFSLYFTICFQYNCY